MKLVKFVTGFFLVIIAWGGLRMIDQGHYRGLVFVLIPVFLWNWRWCLEFIQDRRWRDNWRYW